MNDFTVVIIINIKVFGIMTCLSHDSKHITCAISICNNDVMILYNVIIMCTV